MFGIEQFEHLIKGRGGQGEDKAKGRAPFDADAETSSIFKRIFDPDHNGDEGDAVEAGNLKQQQQQQFDDSNYCCGLCSSLTFGERLFGCLLMHVGGYILDLGSLHRFFRLISGSPLPFVATWTLGHIVCLMGTTFLIGPRKQLQGMFHESRRKPATAYLSTMAVTAVIVIICVALDRPTGFWIGLVLVLLLLCQCVCIAWYTISYIKFLHDFIKKKLEVLKKQLQNDPNAKRSANNSAGKGWMIWKRNEYEQIV
mmetsp:Transcript_26492/g.76456  ORF Transcript_26492/g.76456 Transcript_26492/m.76456 type:complete len:255 (-) Transcript_26492:53-817(-)|eukprot:CAMPEP_0181049436 /NCGR_PEP_ID=MMETSP1070-20121207/15981_1 /TAXON_ID=265543 /ORGANISM="Minutocellus polymorphus, Strain NH13" /LENGTH=254 /DNA_ID=CAMNT_0023128313 /DNA_START=87 /DNA_END=848 /DNA_ORIENTATION=+